MKPRVISFVEDGWESARMLSLAVARELGWPVDHYIKGGVAPDVVALMSPQDGVRIRPLARPWFRGAAWGLLARAALSRHPTFIVVDNERMRHRARSVTRNARVIFAREQFRHLTYEYDGVSFTREALIERFRQPACA